MDEEVDILKPPFFEPSGEVKIRRQAYHDGDWIGTFNLWIVTQNPEPSIIYQQRSPQASWAPGMLDVAAGGHLRAGEHLTDGLREAEEELGRTYNPDSLIYLGKKLYVGSNADGSSKNNVIDVYFIQDDAPLDQYKLQKEEVYAICSCPISELLKAHRDEKYAFTVIGLNHDGEKINIDISAKSFPLNYDSYHYKMALLADRYFKGDRELLY